VIDDDASSIGLKGKRRRIKKHAAGTGELKKTWGIEETRQEEDPVTKKNTQQRNHRPSDGLMSDSIDRRKSSGGVGGRVLFFSICVVFSLGLLLLASRLGLLLLASRHVLNQFVAPFTWPFT